MGTAVFRAQEHVRTFAETVKKSFRKGQLSTGNISEIKSFDVEVAYMDTKYPFRVERISPATRCSPTLRSRPRR